MKKLPISAIIITYNEEKNIEDCLKSICEWAEEIFIVDSFSNDRTVEIANRFTDKIYQHHFENFAQQRNWSQGDLPIKNEWVFHLDADERVSAELALELQKIFETSVLVDGFMMSRKTIFRNKWIRFGGHYPVFHLRLFKKNKGRSEERLYDQNYIVDGTILRLKGDIINIINPDIDYWKFRHRRWAELEAQEILLEGNKSMNLKFKGNPIERRNWLRYKVYYKLPLFIRPFLYFFYRSVIRFGFLDGIEGLIFHFYHGLWYRLLVDLNVSKPKRLGIRQISK